MSNIHDIEQAVRNLSPNELETFRRWFADYDAENWDRHLEQDVAAGRLDELANEAIRNTRDGKSTDL